MKKKSEWFLRLPQAMVQSAAFRSLGGLAVKTLIELQSRFNGRNNGSLFLSCRDGAHLLDAKAHRIGAALDEAEARGFIVRTARGSRAKRVAPRWRLTYVANRGETPTNEWQAWTPGDDLAPDPETAIEHALMEAAE